MLAPYVAQTVTQRHYEPMAALNADSTMQYEAKESFCAWRP